MSEEVLKSCFTKHKVQCSVLPVKHAVLEALPVPQRLSLASEHVSMSRNPLHEF